VNSTCAVSFHAFAFFCFEMISAQPWQCGPNTADFALREVGKQCCAAF
jgi:hypothetical protein